MGNKFIRDIDIVIKKFEDELTPKEYDKIMVLREDLLAKYHKNQVKINHSVMELICAKYLVQNGFDVNIEYDVNGLSTDIYAQKGLGSLIVEVETGFVPPDHALDPLSYLRARVSSKITRYSAFANKFILAGTPFYIMQIPASLVKPPRYRTEEEVLYIKSMCDQYYRNPPVTLEEIRNARLHSIYIVNVDKAAVREWEVNEYMGKAALWSV
ncbi:MAG: hypothetical protein NWE89_09610 [Candidatus Bathyarchaeota archaeon]|nr:hypothetical protein [Candidatus Bathyarchaeota archaeon]